MFLITSLLLFIIFAQVTAEECVTPNDELAECVSLFECPTFLTAIQTREKAILEFYGNSTCGGTVANPKVCCGSSIAFKDSTQDSGSSKLLEYEATCGVQDSAVSEFPWYARIRYQHPIRPFYMCTGSLITDKYVLTASSCMYNFIPEAVRLGKYNPFNKIECTEDSQLLECNEEVREYGIKDMIRHPNYGEQLVYNATETLLRQIRNINDVGLIRLNESVRFSDYIRPLCLPFTGTPKIADGDEVTVLKTDHFDFNVKTQFVRNVLNRVDCEYRVGTIHFGQMCTVPAVESCQVQNTGGPVMISRNDKGNRKWYLVGVEPGQYITCYKNETRVYTDIRYYIDWIEKTIKS